MKAKKLGVLFLFILYCSLLLFLPISGDNIALSSNDSFLYKRTLNHKMDEELTLASYEINSNISGYKIHQIMETDSIYEKSFTVIDFANEYSIVNSTERTTGVYQYNFEENWTPSAFNGGILFSYNGNTTKESYPNSVSSSNSLEYILMSSLSTFDIGNYGEQDFLYIKSYTEDFIINGKTHSLSIDEYHLYSRESNVYNETYYDIEYPANYTYITEITLKVDNSTGLIIDVERDSYSEYWYATTQFSTELNEKIDYERFQHITEHEHLFLYETTVNYAPVIDADLPSLVLLSGEYVDLLEDMSELIVPVYINDFSEVNLSIFIDDIFWQEYDGLRTGKYQFVIPEEKIIPNINETVNLIEFKLIDSSNHNTSWYLFIEDLRDYNADWNPWIIGPEEVLIQDSNEILSFQIYSSTVWWSTTYIFDNSDWVFFDSEYGYKNDTILLSLEDFPSGNYEFLIQVYDYSENLAELNVNVAYDPIDKDLEAPFIDGPEGFMEITQGEISSLNWSIFEDHPLLFQILLNNSIVANVTFEETDFTINFNISSLAPGNYNITIFVVDENNNYSTLTLILKINQTIEETNNTETTSLPDDKPNPTKINFLTFLLAIPAITLVKLIRRKRY